MLNDRSRQVHEAHALALARLYRAVIERPFNTELTAGTLSEARFALYVKQDWPHLADFSRAPGAMELQRFPGFAGEDFSSAVDAAVALTEAAAEASDRSAGRFEADPGPRPPGATTTGNRN